MFTPNDGTENLDGENGVTYQTFVEHERGESRQTAVAPVSMDQQQSLQEHEAGNGKVRGHHRLHAFLSGDSDPNICNLDHADVISSVTCVRCKIMSGVLNNDRCKIMTGVK